MKKTNVCEEYLNCAKIKLMTNRILFMGSPEFAVPILDALVKIYPVVGVVTQPDRPAGRGMVLTPPPVKELALKYNLPIFQPDKINTDESYQTLQNYAADLIIVAAYGQILKQRILDLPQFGCINVHASLLPRWRGASPIQTAILNGDQQSGVTIMKMDAGMDTGDMIAKKALPISSTDTAVSLSESLSKLGAEFLLEVLPDYLAGNIQARPQPEQGVTYAHLIKKQEGELDIIHSTAEVLERKVRAFDPWPGTFLIVNQNRLKVLKASVISARDIQPGMRKNMNGLPAIATQSGWLVLDIVQPAGKKATTGAQYLCGARDWETNP